MSTVTDNAFAAALKTRDKAHAPYSNYKVGATVKAKGHDQLISGCNVENASYPAGMCAERNAVNSMIATFGPDTVLEFVVVVTSNKNGASPCGICRQVIAEFSDEDTKVYLAGPDGIKKTTTTWELLPDSFTRKDLQDVK